MTSDKPGQPQVPRSGCRLLAWTTCIAVSWHVAGIFRVEIREPSLTSDWSGRTVLPHISSFTFPIGPNVIYAPTTLSVLMDHIPWNTGVLSNSFVTFIVSAATCKKSFKRIEGCGVVWCGVVWCGVVWCGVVWCGMFLRNVAVTLQQYVVPKQ